MVAGAVRRTLASGVLAVLALGVGGLPYAVAQEPVAPPASPSATPSSAASPTPEPSASPSPSPSVVPASPPADEPAGVAVGTLDCSSLSAEVTLDNASEADARTFTVRVSDAHTVTSQESVEVAGRGATSLTVTLLDDSPNLVTVLSGADVLATRYGVCGTPVVAPRASAGAVDCAVLTVPVSLDNSGSTTSAVFEFYPSYSYWDYVPGEPTMTQVVAGGTTAEVDVPVEEGAGFRLTTRAEGTGAPDLQTTVSGLCGLVTLDPVDCRVGSVRLTLDNTSWYPKPRRLSVSSSAYPEDPAAFHRSVTLEYRATEVVDIPLTALAGGRVQVSEYDWGVLTSLAVEGQCPEGSADPEPGTTPTAGAGALAATGAEGLPQLVLAGLLAITLGGVLLRVGRERRG